MTSLFRPLKRRMGVLVTGIAVLSGLGVVASLVAGDAVLAASAGMLLVGYGIAILVGLFTARNPQSAAFLLVAAGGVLLTVSALAGAWVIIGLAALLLAVGGGLLFRAGQLRAANGGSSGNEPPA
jgi:uncharacterized membrane protein HdeD (DUF308 family)